ncbi:MAG: hypothetical protein OK455_02220 [Thaumarchaeota archaeon]|nr:hypothetical protein [Nitrososphaerota archaeon]
MKLYLVIPGALFALAGLIFTLQGEGVVGPVGSFMYQNVAWVYQGIVVLIVGLLLLAAGVWKRRTKQVV